MLNLRNSLTSSRMSRSYRDFSTRTLMKSWKISKTSSRQIWELITTWRIHSSLACLQESTPSSGTRSSLTFTRSTPSLSRRDKFRWSWTCRYTLEVSRLRMAVSIWLVVATREETSTLRSVTGTTRSSLCLMRRPVWFTLTLTTLFAVWRVSFMLSEASWTARSMALAKFTTSERTSGRKSTVSECPEVELHSQVSKTISSLLLAVE